MKPKNFLNAIDTLKLYRRAELVSKQGKQLITKLYVDPLPNEHILQTVLRPNTTFLLGRKGTGKSTIFQRAQEAINSNKNSIWAYIDIKTLYESSTSEIIGGIPDGLETSLTPETIHKIYIFKRFLLDLTKEIKNQIKTKVNSSLVNQFKEAFTGSATELFEKLDEFIEEIENDHYFDATGVIQAQKQDANAQKNSIKAGSEVGSKISANPSVQAKLFAELFTEFEKKKSNNYAQVFIKIFNVRGLILRLREILSELNLRHLYIFIDDFSELPREDMEQVVDTILSPFNNWSEEFIKLKIAVYPGRLYPGEIDLSKADEIYLDIYRGYGRNDLPGMEEKAIDFTKRLITTRINYYCNQTPEVYFEIEAEDFWRILFYSCLGNPRILGYILYYCYEISTIYNKRIGIRTIQAASRRYYEEKIFQYFRLNKFLHETFEERSSIYSLKELLEEIVVRAKELRTYRESKVMKDIQGRPPTSHFHVLSEYDQVLSTLELNFFITKYYEMKDRDGNEVSVYALNYGLCQQQTIAYGRPQGKREHRLYFVERIFDDNPIIASYIKVNQEILCDHCGHRHSHEMLPAIQAFDMLCPVCKKGQCKVVNLSRKYERLINEVSKENLLPSTELGILKTLHDERRQLFAKQIAEELDCSYQLIGKRGKNLAERNLVDRTENDKGRRVFELKSKADELYFSESQDDQMNFGE
jgi:hypothetical protein